MNYPCRRLLRPATAFPNPFQERFSLSLRPGWLPVGAWVEVYDAVDRRVHRQMLRAAPSAILNLQLMDKTRNLQNVAVTYIDSDFVLFTS